MTGPQPDGVPSTTRVWVRQAAAAAITLVGGPLLLLYMYGLAWFLPSVTTGDVERPADAAPGPEQATAWWTVLLLAVSVGSLGLVLTWVRSIRPGRWWLWPFATVAGLAAGWPMMDRLA